MSRVSTLTCEETFYGSKCSMTCPPFKIPFSFFESEALLKIGRREWSPFQVLSPSRQWATWSISKNLSWVALSLAAFQLLLRLINSFLSSMNYRDQISHPTFFSPLSLTRSQEPQIAPRIILFFLRDGDSRSFSFQRTIKSNWKQVTKKKFRPGPWV